MFATLLLVALSAFAQENKKLSLEDIKSYAISNNFGVRAAEAEVDEMKAQTQISRSPMFPKLNLIAGPEVRSDSELNKTDNVGYVEGSWNLFRGSQDRVAVEVSELNQSIAESKLKQTRFELELEIEKLFYEFLYLDLRSKALESALGLNENHRKLLNQKKASGMASTSDIMEFEIRASHLKSELSSTEQKKSETRLGLTRLMGPKIGTAFEPYGKLPKLKLKDSMTEFLSKINSTSEGVRSASLQSSAAALGAKAARLAWLPSVELEARYGKLPMDENLEAPGFEAGLFLKWELFSGFETSGKIAEASARAAKFDNEFKKKLLATMTEAETSFSKLSSMQERIQVEEGNEARSQKYYSAVLSEYRRGVKNGADLRSAEETLLDAKSRAAEFRYLFLANKIDLEKSIGFIIKTESQGGEK